MRCATKCNQALKPQRLEADHSVQLRCFGARKPRKACESCHSTGPWLTSNRKHATRGSQTLQPPWKYNTKLLSNWKSMLQRHLLSFYGLNRAPARHIQSRSVQVDVDDASVWSTKPHSSADRGTACRRGTATSAGSDCDVMSHLTEILRGGHNICLSRSMPESLSLRHVRKCTLPHSKNTAAQVPLNSKHYNHVTCVYSF